jgi:hypothetical protein
MLIELIDGRVVPARYERNYVRLRDGRALALDQHREVVWEGYRWWAPYSGAVIRKLKDTCPRSLRLAVAYYPNQGYYHGRYYHLFRSPVRGVSLRELWGEAATELERRGGNSNWEWQVAPILRAWLQDPAWKRERAARAALEALGQ